jgi:hypothetical protein
MKPSTACELTETSLSVSEQRRNLARFRSVPLLPAKLGSVLSQPVAFATGCQETP